ncbi:unnamed protein product [Ectocarpus sp. 12 AP-2014]
MKSNPKTKKKYCQKHYPQPFRSSLQTNKCGRAEYRRLNNDIVPYNLYLLMKYDCHICFDLVTAKAVIAYLYKYAYKKEDSVRARVTYKDNEIEAYRSVRYISSSEAMWHIFGFHTQERTPSVNLLYVHREGEQPVIHDEADEPAERQAAADNAVSHLMKYFGRQRQSKRTRSNDDNDDGNDYVPSTVPHFRGRYRNFVYLKSTFNVSRIQYMSPDQGDIWFLRLLLLNRPASSFRQLRCIDGIEHEIYEQCARELALVHDTNEYAICMQEAAQFATARELRRVFPTLILHGASAPQLWEQFQTDLTFDFAPTMTAAASIDASLKHIDLMLNKHGRSTNQLGLPNVKHDNTEYDSLIGAFSTSEQEELCSQMTPQLTQEQRSIFDTVTTSATENKGAVSMIDAPGQEKHSQSAPSQPTCGSC